MDFDRHLTSPARLSIVAALVAPDRLSFTDLRSATGLADGNLHAQTENLIKAGYLTKSKSVKNERSVTCFSLSQEGISAFELHIRKLQRVLETGRRRLAPPERQEYRDDSRVW